MDDSIDRALRARLSPHDLQVEDGFVELRHQLTTTRRRRRWWAASAAAAVMVVAGTAGAAVATGGTHTGIFGKPGFTENDTSEYLKVGAPDWREVVDGYAHQHHDFAPGYSADDYLGLLSPEHFYRETPDARTRGIEVQVTFITGAVQGWAFCSWAQTSQTDPVALSHMRAIAGTKVMAATNQKNVDLALLDQADAGDPGPLHVYATTECPDPLPWPAS